jgi:hypothetical protein
MNISARSLAFGFVGLVLMAWIAISLGLGVIPERRGGISKSREPFRFYGVIFGYAVIATLMVGAAIIFWLHPSAGHSGAVQGVNESWP